MSKPNNNKLETFGLVGRLAVQAGLINPKQLAEALYLQGRYADRQVGAILVEKGYITPRQLEALLAAQNSERRKMGTRQRKREEAPRGPITDMALPAVNEALGANASNQGPGLDKKLMMLLQLAWDAFASDLHVHSGSKPFMRVHGHNKPLHHQPLEAEEVRAMITSFLSPEQLGLLESKGDVDLSWAIDNNARLRVNCFMATRGLGASFRIHPMKIPTLEAFSLPPILARCVSFHQGIVLVTGPSGSGKTSTIAALLNLINEERKDNVITVEDPIEFVHKPLQANILQRQLGRDVETYSNALKGALRQDPDVIVVGELRDLETIGLALSAAETGHLVLASMHTIGAISTIDRLIGSFPTSQQNQIRAMFSESMRAIVSQQLIPSVNGRRVPALELVFNTPAMANLIREGSTYKLPNLIQLGKRVGMRTFKDSLIELLEKGLIKPEEAKQYAAA